MKDYKNKINNIGPILAWASYDLANQFFALNIVSLYFVRWVTVEKAVPEIFFSIFFAVSTFLVVLFSPILGTISDLTRKRRLFLISLTLLSVFFTMLLGFCQSVWTGLVFFAIANFGCQLAVIFYNALMMNIAPQQKIGLVSGLGKMFGYTGAMIALYIFKPIVLAQGYQAVFFPTGVLFLLFALPCMIFVRDVDPREDIAIISFFSKKKMREIFLRLKQAYRESSQFRGLKNFLKASFLGLCTVNVMIIFMSVYATKVFGLQEDQIIRLIIFSTVFAILGSIGSGYISDKIGGVLSLKIIFISWGICFSLGAVIHAQQAYWILGGLVGVSLGSVWVVLRAVAIQLVPADRMGEFFGLFNIFGYLSGVVGSLFWGLMILILSPLGNASYRISLFSLNVFLIFGFIFLVRMGKEFER